MDVLHVTLLSLLFPGLVYIAVPRILAAYGYDPKKHHTLLVVACVIMLVSWYLPSPLVEGNDTSFTTHFVGGGVFCGLLWVYVTRSMRWKAVWFVELASLYMLVCSLGVANELFELALYKLRIMETVTDTSWDLLANTLGAFMFFAGLKASAKHKT